MTLRLARTPAEAHLFMDLHPCEVCGTEEFDRTFSIFPVGDDLASRYTGTCPECGNPREFTFRIPDETPIPDPDEPSFGDDRPSELLDAGEWLWVADDLVRGLPAEPDGLDTEERRRARREILRAAAAVAEARKFVPPGADAVPAEAFRTPNGRATYDAEPGRFHVERLAIVEGVYREIADSFAVE